MIIKATFDIEVPDDPKSAGSEIEKYRALIWPWCLGAGVEIASQGVRAVPWAISYDLPHDAFMKYSGGHPAKGPIHLRGDARFLPFESGSLDFVCCSHYAEDLPRSEWPELFMEWQRVVRPGGNVICLVPERERWAAALRRGQTPNCSHWGPEPLVGDMSKAAQAIGMTVMLEKLTDLYPGDYTILGVFRR